MKNLPIVALIGQTNAGKSSLLNRFAHRNIAIVAREAGTTRDSVTARIDDRFLMIDTAGLKDAADDFEASIQDQIADAIESADLILLTLDSTLYVSEKDKRIAKMALKSQKPVFLVLNKSDLKGSLDIFEFRSLGIKPDNTFRVSATTGYGLDELKNNIYKIIPNLKQEKSETLKLALIGRPNVGKSSLFNSLAKKQQAIVSSRQGTTRDVNRVEIKFKGRDLEILDTAGLRKPGRREVGIEKFSAIRTLAAIEESDICALLVDATEPHSKLDQSLAGQIVEAGKGIVVVLTKTDLKTHEEIEKILDDLEYDFNFLPFAPVLLTSSETGANVTKLFDLALEIDEARHTELKTSDLNKVLNQAILEHAPAGLKNTRPKPKYIVQTDTCPPWFVVHGHGLSTLHWSWKRFLENKLREAYPFVGTPIMFSYRDDKVDKID
ncbi:ribosome biogenesis GTPase Der [Candidatus Saccharibacteria bacterium]|nr:ribosome biogenesis GTPase Der [Candidatus Saccharibacteria bacterium]MBR6122027.1 ribosome biogenesis GTPase Der [Candidatus Saccharibacteria bacterium]